MGGQPITLTGRSGRSHSFTLFPMGTSFDPVGGIYVAISRQSPVALAYPRPNTVGDGLAAQYVGQTSDLSRRPEQHEPCFALVGVSHIAVMMEHQETRREQIVVDLIATLQPPLNRTDQG